MKNGRAYPQVCAESEIGLDISKKVKSESCRGLFEGVRRAIP